MKIIPSLIIILQIFFFFNLEAYSISNLEIYKICKKQRREKECIKRLKTNRELLKEGRPIEIPVIPFKKY